MLHSNNTSVVLSILIVQVYSERYMSDYLHIYSVTQRSVKLSEDCAQCCTKMYNSTFRRIQILFLEQWNKKFPTWKHT